MTETATATMVATDVQTTSPTVVDSLDITTEERAKYAPIVAKINIADLNSVMALGSEYEKTIGKNSKATSLVASKSIDEEYDSLINDLRKSLGYIDSSDFTPSTFLKIARNIPILRLLVSSVEDVANKYKTIGDRVGEISNKVQVVSLSAKQDNNDLEVNYKEDVESIRHLREVIKVLRLKIEEVDAKKREIVENGGEEYEIFELDSFKEIAEQRIFDLIGMCELANQELHQIRMVQKNNILVSNRALTLVNNGVPHLVTQLSLANAVKRQKENINALKKTTDVINEIAVINAKTIHENAIAVATEAHRGIISVETLRTTTDELLTTIDDLQRVTSEARKEREQIEKKIGDLNLQIESKIVGGEASKELSSTISGLIGK